MAKVYCDGSNVTGKVVFGIIAQNISTLKALFPRYITILKCFLELICHGYLQQVFAVKICHCFFVCKQSLFILCISILFVNVSFYF